MPQPRPVLQALLLAGGSLYGATSLHSVVKVAQREQRKICVEVEDRAGKVRQPKVAVDGLFAARLGNILKM